MAHGNCESMRSRAFTKGRSAFDSDDEYRRALNGEFDEVREDFSYEANEDPDDGEESDAEDPREEGGEESDDEDPWEEGGEEAVKAELEHFEDRVGRTHFLEVLEKFMQRCSGCGEPPYLPFKPVRDVEHIAVFDAGTEALRLRYGAYGLEADRLEGDEVVETWRGLDEIDVLAELAEEAEEAELEREDLEDRLKDKFFDDLPGVLADRKRGAEFLDFVTKEGGTMSTLVLRLSESEPKQLWLVLDRTKSGFRLIRPGGDGGVLATWDREEFLEKLREVAWDDPDARDFLLGGELKEAWDALDDAWYDEDEDGLVADSVEKFLADVEDAKKDPCVGLVKRNVAVCEEADAGRVEMKTVWGRTYPDAAELTFSRDGREETFGEVPLAFLRWWRFCRKR